PRDLLTRDVRDPVGQQTATQDALGDALTVEERRDPTVSDRPARTEDHAHVDLAHVVDDAFVEHRADLLGEALEDPRAHPLLVEARSAPGEGPLDRGVDRAVPVGQTRTLVAQRRKTG